MSKSVNEIAVDIAEHRNRYIVVEGSQSDHCDFKFTVVDTNKPEIVNDEPCIVNDKPVYQTICECFEKSEADQIVMAMNASMYHSPAQYVERERIDLIPGYHAEPGESKFHLHDLFTTKGELYGNQRIWIGSVMECFVTDLVEVLTAPRPRRPAGRVDRQRKRP